MKYKLQDIAEGTMGQSPKSEFIILMVMVFRFYKEIDIHSNVESQKKISRVLAMLDEKIQINSEINNNLYE